MAEEPNLDLSESDDGGRFPWLILVVIIAVTAAAGTWLMKTKAKSDSITAALQQEVTIERDALDKERDKVFDITRELDALRAQISGAGGEAKAKAVAQYNALAAEQRAQRVKVKEMADKYNEKVAKLHELQ